MKRWAWIAGMAVLCAELCFAQAGTRVRVTGKRVNLRARPELNSEVVAQSGDGDLLTARSFQGEWVEVIPPESVDVWVHRDFVADNKVSANKLHVRGGPGINYASVGEMARGDAVIPRGDFGEWIKVAPPPGCALWVSRDYIEVLQPEKPRPPVVEAPPVAEGAPEPAAPAAPAPVRPVREPMIAAPTVPSQPAVPPASSPPSVPEDLKLIPLEGQGKMVQREGVLRLAGFVFGRPSRYRLVRQEGNRIETLCYVRGNNAQLSTFTGRRLLVRGREYWVQGVRDPVVIPEQIIPRAGD